MAMRWAGILVLAALAACGSEATESGDAARALVATRSTTFGDPEGEGALSNVFGVAVARDGRVFLSEPQFRRVVAFGADGSFARVVGEQGQGPGEFQSPGALMWRGDSLAVSDFQRAGIHLFSPEGRFATLVSFTLDEGPSPFGVRPIFPLADGSVAAAGFAPNSMVADGTITDETWLKVSRDGAVLDTLAILPLEGRYYSVQAGERGRSAAHPLAWAPMLAAPPSGTSVVIVDPMQPVAERTAAFRVARVDVYGDTVKAVDLPYDPLPITASQIDSIANAIAQRWSANANETTATLAAAIEDQVGWPEHQPAVTQVLAGDDGSVWLRREMVGAPSARWDVLDADLEMLGRVELPRGLEMKVVAIDRVYGIERDAFDVPQVVRFDVAAGG